MAGRNPMGGPPSASNPASGRYAYLVARLRNRQITMEEATELFAVMDETIRMLRTAPVRPPAAAAPARPAAPPSSGPPAKAGAGGPGMGADDMLTAGVLMIGAGAGIYAALRRKVAEEQRAASSPAEAPSK